MYVFNPDSGEYQIMYTLQELNEANNLNRIIGACIGVSVTLVSELGWVWFHGWVL